MKRDGPTTAAAWSEGSGPGATGIARGSMHRDGPTAAGAWSEGSGRRVAGKAFIGEAMTAPQLIAAAVRIGPMAEVQEETGAPGARAAEQVETGARAGGVNPPFTLHVCAELSGQPGSGMTIQD